MKCNSVQPSKEIDAPFLIEGIITELQVSLGKENLLNKINKHYKEKSVLTGFGAAVGDMYGQAAASASLAMYEGEYTENFMCMIDDQIMCGTFGGASKLPVGQKVKAVVQKQGDVLVAEGILSESEGLVWVNYPLGCKAERMANFKIAWWGFWSQLIFMFFASWITDGIGTSFFWAVLSISFFGMGAILLGMAFWNSSTMNALADPATEIFRMLGFAEPEKINLNSYRYGIVHGQAVWDANETQESHFNVHCYKKAIEDGKLKMAIQ